MQEDLKHIDELFKKSLDGAQVSAPDGLFDRCIEQVNAIKVSSASKMSNGSMISNAVESVFGVMRGWKLGLISVLPGQWVLWVLAAVMVSAVAIWNGQRLPAPSAPLNTQKTSQTKPIPPVVDATNQLVVAPPQTNSPTNDRPLLVANAGNQIVKKQENEILTNNDVRKQKLEPVVYPLDKNLAASPNVVAPLKRATWQSVPKANAAVARNPQSNSAKSLDLCGTYQRRWKPVLNNQLGGVVFVDLEGDFSQMTVNWGDGELQQINSNGQGVIHLEHGYYVAKSRKFELKFTNELLVNGDQRGPCKDSLQLDVMVAAENEISEMVVPDAFTPNGDGLNDEFFVIMAKPLHFEMTILDSKQRTVFRSNDYTGSWDGKCGSGYCNETNYRIIISYKYSGDKEWRYYRNKVKLIRNNNSNTQN